MSRPPSPRSTGSPAPHHRARRREDVPRADEGVGHHLYALRFDPAQRFRTSRMQRRAVDQDRRPLRLGDGAPRLLDHIIASRPSARRACAASAREGGAPSHATSAGMVGDAGPGGGPVARLERLDRQLARISNHDRPISASARVGPASPAISDASRRIVPVGVSPHGRRSGSPSARRPALASCDVGPCHPGWPARVSSKVKAGTPAMRIAIGLSAATPSNRPSTLRMRGSRSSAVTRCISLAPGLAKHAATPVSASDPMIASAPVMLLWSAPRSPRVFLNPNGVTRAAKRKKSWPRQAEPAVCHARREIDEALRAAVSQVRALGKAVGPITKQCDRFRRAACFPSRLPETGSRHIVAVRRVAIMQGQLAGRTMMPNSSPTAIAPDQLQESVTPSTMMPIVIQRPSVSGSVMSPSPTVVSVPIVK